MRHPRRPKLLPSHKSSKTLGVSEQRGVPLPTAEEEPTTTNRVAPWYKDAVLYELRVRSFFDGNNDGIGDFLGLTQKLGYLQDLGITALWILPFYPSPLRDDGYDISDYLSVHREVGTLEDFCSFLQEAHRRGLRVITELVLNHTSDQHPWFQRARRAPVGTPERDFYVWSDTPTRYGEARVIFKDFEDSNWTWDSTAEAWYWHRFYSHQPDLNFDNPLVVQALLEVLGFWLGLGVDGLRLDAIPYLFEREGTSCENLPETHALLRTLRKHVDECYPDRLLLAEANQWPEDAAAYFGKGDECHMAFHFPIMPRLFLALRTEDRFPLVDILGQTPAIPEQCQWALFLRNHDELTLEMVTEEERDYLWQTHAQDRNARINQGIRRRLAPLLGNSRRRLELLNALLLSLPGTPVLYYGDEIGMGDNLHLGDRNGVRTPMQWSSDRNAGFSAVDPQRLILPVVTSPEYHYQTVNVETQQSNPGSLLWWTKRMIALRKQKRVFGLGKMHLLRPRNPRVFAFVRRLGEEAVLVVANLSRFVQYVELDLAAYTGARPRELIGGARFPPVRAKPYPLSLGPHGFYWMTLSEARREERPRGDRIPVTKLPAAWADLGSEPGRGYFAEILRPFLRRAPWATESHAGLRSLAVVDSLPLPFGDTLAHLLVVAVEPVEGLPVKYVVALALASGPFADTLLARFPETVVARTQTRAGDTVGLVHDALADKTFCLALLRFLDSSAALSGRVVGDPLGPWTRLRGAPDLPTVPQLPRFEPHSTLVEFGDRLTMTFLRRLEPEPQPEEEVFAALSEDSPLLPLPLLAGVLRVRSSADGETAGTLALVSAQQQNVGNAWRYTVGELGRFFDTALGLGELEHVRELNLRPILDDFHVEASRAVREQVGSFLVVVERMAVRVAALHVGLASLDEEGFRPEPFTTLYQRSLYQGIRSAAVRAFQRLAERAEQQGVPSAGLVLRHQRELLALLRPLLAERFSASRTRIHGDLHLGRLLYTGGDFLLADLGGDPEKPLTQRRIKRCPLRDVATLLGSFHRATSSALQGGRAGAVRIQDRRVLRTWARAWLRAVISSFLEVYCAATTGKGLTPQDSRQVRALLTVYLLERQTLAIARHVGHASAEVEIALDALEQLL